MNPYRSRKLLSAASAAIALMACAAAAAADDESAALRMITAPALRQDAVILQRALEALHPGLYSYNTPDQMNGHFATLRRALDHDQPVREAYLAISQFTATIKCGHTYPNFYNQPKALRESVFERGGLVPFEFRWLGKRMIVT